ncbi:WD40-repeat-containing domain protein [Kockovaella imperatae]|uniref:WD40-repeat-containing domain protein n=1 Tax=Kockovaella imperatae TaxID=4999 RepID=A0A1Y1UFZ2_9TREE|nr:WD40-repeat-containing domain protein [Kockovaella imperatae]ORX36899.1 WD40-repeat-containing domain protein [Kockovaella imperatae]
MLRPVHQRPGGYLQNNYQSDQQNGSYHYSQFNNQQQQQQPQQQQHQPQQQSQQQLSQNQQQQQQQTSMDGQSNAASGSGPSGGPEMSLAGVLHYLQSEWRRWERDRNEWEIERAEMRARIALLEGQRRSAENLKVDLLRRVKMLEYALRQERTKSMSTAGKSSTLAPSRLSAIQDEDKVSNRDEKEASPMSEGSEEGDRVKMNGPRSIAASSKLSSVRNGDNPWKNVGSVSRDPKARARSREYLKQCLQEITYLTSPGALNPLPPRPPINIDAQSSNRSSEPEQAALNHSEQFRPPTKTLPDDGQVIDLFPKEEPQTTSSLEPVTAPQAPNGEASASEVKADSDPVDAQPTKTVESRAMAPNATARPPHSPSPKPVALPDANGPSASSELNGEEHQLLTAIYRPESKTAWREELQAANDKAEQARLGRSPSEQSDEEQLANLTLNIEDEDAKPEPSNAPGRFWAGKKYLRSHMDIVRAVAIVRGRGSDLLLVSAGDDNVVKVWSLDAYKIWSTRRNDPEIEPLLTYRGHTAPVTSVVVDSDSKTIFSASLDSTIRVWRMPGPRQNQYTSYDPGMAVQTLEGHTNAVWDLLLRQDRDVGPRLFSISSDKTLRMWVKSANGLWTAERSLTLDGTPTCLGYLPYPVISTRVLVGFADGRVKWIEGELGETILTWQDQEPEGRASQVNSIISDLTLNMVAFGHEDGSLRVYELGGSRTVPKHHVVAHSSPVTSLCLSPISPMAILTASTDCRIRVWDVEKKVFVQDLTGHRPRSDEGVCALAVTTDVPVLSSAGADGIIRIWAWGGLPNASWKSEHTGP